MAEAPQVDRRPTLEVLTRRGEGGRRRSPMLFVHGLGHRASTWTAWMDAAAREGRDSYALSLRGHGESSGRVRTARLAQYVDDVARIAARIGEPPVLVGHSLGGLVVQQAAEIIHSRATVLVTPVPARPGIGSLVGLFRQHPVDGLKIMAGATLPLRAEYLYEHLGEDEAARYIAECGPESPIAQYQILMHRKPGPPKGGSPVLVIGALKDRLIPVSDVRATSRHYGADLLEFPDIGHNVMQDKGYDEVWGALSDWLAKVEGGTATP